VQDGAIFGDVDFVAAEHSVNARPQAGFFREIQQQGQRLVVDAILGIVEVDAEFFERELLAALGVVVEQLAQVRGLKLLVVRL